ncbi:hypothetical protein LTR37_010545 [Vermiconidia calcicola]|uniref:Uncharacterized protein n=1 Tax=Vermiconidia calcicola TaxID=1690605 RepID=A0ACC3N4U7_9PEZI|nr:hypothetical protein LTR37_010545 [Vermiconidia calcicola]
MYSILLTRLWISFLSVITLIHAPVAESLPSTLAPRELIGSEADEAEADFPGTKFMEYVSRPDIKAPRFHLKVYDKEAISGGYWFVAPYHNLDQQDNAKSWVGPYIYDNSGELIWCGAAMFNHYNTYDFKTARVDGEDMLALKYPHGNTGTIFDNTYRVRREVLLSEDKKDRDMHEFNLIEDGSRVLQVISTEHESTVEQAKAIGLGKNETCNSLWKGIQEVDTLTSEPVFTWDARDHLGLDEVTYMPGPYERMCQHNWDILHLNAVDQFPDGDYLVSSRHTDTLYKISRADGSVVWRLGGKKSDFEFDNNDARFSRQHHATVRGQNETHTLVAMFDNAIGTGSKNEEASYKNSRGLLLALQHNSSTASIAAQYDHPHGSMTNSRGSFQTLPNGNAFLGWTYHTLISEHTADGRLVMEASLKLPGHCYRSYKFPWVGHPAQPPDVYATTLEVKDDNSSLRTVVYVSWNGATEVASWNLYRSDGSGNKTELVASVPRQGFETTLVYDVYASHVVAEALDSNEMSLGRSEVVQPIPPSDILSDEIVADAEWLENEVAMSFTEKTISVLDSPVKAFFGGVGATIVLGAMVWATWFWRRDLFGWCRREGTAYKSLLLEQTNDRETDMEAGEEKEILLQNNDG